jgi:hypothetical protein
LGPKAEVEIIFATKEHKELRDQSCFVLPVVFCGKKVKLWIELCVLRRPFDELRVPSIVEGPAEQGEGESLRGESASRYKSGKPLALVSWCWDAIALLSLK